MPRRRSQVAKAERVAAAREAEARRELRELVARLPLGADRFTAKSDYIHEWWIVEAGVVVSQSRMLSWTSRQFVVADSPNVGRSPKVYLLTDEFIRGDPEEA